jgi:enoyl-[acyl-carrier-protein] reductase (NADH)
MLVDRDERALAKTAAAIGADRVAITAADVSDAVIGLMKTAALELAPMHIRVNSLNPGPIENRMRSIEEQAAPGKAELVKHGFLSVVAMSRYGSNEEMARVALFLASDDSSYCTDRSSSPTAASSRSDAWLGTTTGAIL